MPVHLGTMPSRNIARAITQYRDTLAFCRHRNLGCATTLPVRIDTLPTRYWQLTCPFWLRMFFDPAGVPSKTRHSWATAIMVAEGKNPSPLCVFFDAAGSPANTRSSATATMIRGEGKNLSPFCGLSDPAGVISKVRNNSLATAARTGGEGISRSPFCGLPTLQALL